MDKYDKAIEYLEAHPDEISQAWLSIEKHPAGCLFQFASPRSPEGILGMNGCKRGGCLTMIRNDVNCNSFTDELTLAIRSDERIPKLTRHITTIKTLHVFAYWQRKLDWEHRGVASDPPIDPDSIKAPETTLKALDTVLAPSSEPTLPNMQVSIVK